MLPSPASLDEQPYLPPVCTERTVSFKKNSSRYYLLCVSYLFSGLYLCANSVIGIPTCYFLYSTHFLVVQWLGIGLVIERPLLQLPAGALSSQLGQLSLPSLWGRLIKYQPAGLGYAGCVNLCRVAGNTV